MDVCTAFMFVLNAEASRKYVGPQSLAQETQVSFLIFSLFLSFSVPANGFLTVCL